MKRRKSHPRIHHPNQHKTARAAAYSVRKISEHPEVPAILLTWALVWLLSLLLSTIQLEGFSGGLWAVFG